MTDYQIIGLAVFLLGCYGTIRADIQKAKHGYFILLIIKGVGLCWLTFESISNLFK